LINFRYFEEGTDGGEQDVNAIVEGIRSARRIGSTLRTRNLIAEEELPGEQVQSSEALRDYVRYTAWGRNASCTCAIGPKDQGGVLRIDFRVHGATGLRVVDASVFPRTPGFFIDCAVYMIAEKAADIILAESKRPSD